MRKAKIMLMAIAVIAAIGISLAFKVKNMGRRSQNFCYLVTDTQPENGACIEGIGGAHINPSATGTKFFYFETSDETKCNTNQNTSSCPNEAHLPFGV